MSAKEKSNRIVLVGTYKGDQLTKRRELYQILPFPFNRKYRPAT